MQFLHPPDVQIPDIVPCVSYKELGLLMLVVIMGMLIFSGLVSVRLYRCTGVQYT